MTGLVSGTSMRAFLGRRRQRRQARGPQGSTGGTTKARGRRILRRAVPGVGGAGLRPAGVGAGEGRA